MSVIHLWDNSWHVRQPNETIKDSFGRKPRPLNLWGDTKNLKRLSSSTIGNLMSENNDELFVWPISFNVADDELRNQHIFSISEQDGEHIDSVTTGNIVGFIGQGNTDIRIHSRFSSIDVNGNGQDFFLYYMLEKVMALNTFSQTSSSGFKGPQVFDFLLFFFPILLKDAMSQGLYKQYVYNEYNDANIHGDIDVNRHIRLNIPSNGKIAYRTREFSYDNAVTQLIRHTIEFIRRKPFGKFVLHNDPDTEEHVQQIIQATPTFQIRQRQAIINENLRPVTHPYYTKYTALQKLCLRILRYEKQSYGDTGDKIHGILIDAAWLWEEYIAQVLSEGSNFMHYTRHGTSPYLLLQRTDTDRRFQPIIPDYLDNSDPKNVFVADAKYIPLDRFDNLSADRAAAIYYKTIMYMYRFMSKKGFLFHPLPEEQIITDFCEYKIIDTPGHLYEIGLRIPPESNDDYSAFKGKMMKREEIMRETIRKIVLQ